jgi:phosphohistidine phosphatase
MKTLYLLRHAKSSWKDADLSDIDRPLNKRGKINAPEMGKHFKRLKIKPDLIVSSPAKRAFNTATIVAKEMGYEEKNIKIDMALYGANIEQLLNTITNLEPSLDRVMLVGHNPGLTQLANFLGGENIENLPTCGLIRLDQEIKKWSSFKSGKAKLILFEYPKKLEKDKKN